MIIPWQQLSASALQGLLEEYASRDGTDYGEAEVALTDKVAELQQQLQRGEIVIVFDTVTESVSLLSRDQAQQLSRQQPSAEDEYYGD